MTCINRAVVNGCEGFPGEPHTCVRARGYGKGFKTIHSPTQRRDNTMPAMAAKPPKPSSAEASVVACHMLTRDGEPCRKPGQVGLPAGICPEHAIAVYRAVNKLAADTK